MATRPQSPAPAAIGSHRATLSATTLRADGISDALADALDEAPDHLWLFTESDGTAVPDPGLLPPQRIVLLSATDAPTLPGYRQWRAAGPDRWVDADSGACLLRWWVDDPDPRALREQANGLPPRVDAIVLDGPAAGPGLVRELRTLLELLGRG